MDTRLYGQKRPILEDFAIPRGYITMFFFRLNFFLEMSVVSFHRPTERVPLLEMKIFLVSMKVLR